MPTIKISELPQLPTIAANTSNTLFLGVDLPTLTTGQFTATTLAQQLYANNFLVVGDYDVIYPNTIGMFAYDSNNYIQTIIENENDYGTSDVVAQANVSSDLIYYTDMGFAGSKYNNAYPYNSLGTSLYPLDGYLYVQGGGTGTPGGNLVIGTTTAGKQIRFIAGGNTSQNIVASITSAGLYMGTGSLISFGDGSTQNTAAPSIAYAQGINTTQNTNITGVNNIAQGAYNLANTALQNTASIITAGNLTVTGNLITSNIISQNSTIQFLNANFNQNTAFVQITASNNTTSFAPSNTNYMLQITGKANSVTRTVFDSFGQNTYPVLIGRMARGSVVTPAATQNNDVMMRITGNGYTGTQFPSSSPTKIDFVAAENITDLARGTQIQFWNTPTGSNTIQKVATFNADSATFTGTVNPTKGFIYTPLVYPSAQTAITIDFANNSMVRAQTSTGIVVSMSNYTVGKIVEVWITNLSGTNQTYTTGVSAINSTLNATTYNIPGTSTICARYFCVDGTLANTLVSVIHA